MDRQCTFLVSDWCGVHTKEGEAGEEVAGERRVGGVAVTGKSQRQACEQCAISRPSASARASRFFSSFSSLSALLIARFLAKAPPSASFYFRCATLRVSHTHRTRQFNTGYRSFVTFFPLPLQHCYAAFVVNVERSDASTRLWLDGFGVFFFLCLL